MSAPVQAPTDFIHFHRPFIGVEEEQEVLDVLRSGWLTTGARAKQFEADFAVYSKAKHAIAVNSCTAALHVALLALGIGPGDEVITSTITFPATANVIVHCGATPVFVDVEPGTLNMDVKSVEQHITPRTKAIIPVHFAGHPVDVDALKSLAASHRLHVVEDAAHALESEYRGQKVGSISTFTAFSFYATKNITTGEGGMLTTDDDELADKARILSLHGISKDAWKRYTAEGYQHWETLYAGFKYNMNDVQGALGIHQLRRAESFLENRSRLWKAYVEALQDLPQITLLSEKPGMKHGRHLFVIRVNTEMLTVTRDQVLDHLQQAGIGCGVHFRALHTQKFYREQYDGRAGTLPVAEEAGDRVLSLPFYPTLSDAAQTRVIEVVRDLIRCSVR